MNFPEAVSFLFGLRRYPPQPGIETTRDLLAFLGDPQEGVTFVQIAGSNGKGSTACMTERVLRDAGLSVGLYTSPHVESVRERVQVNGRQVPRKSVVAFVEAIREYVIERAAEGDPPTFFEALTALACFEFGRRDVDVAVLEVGIGGRYDATSVVSPTASAVTSVALEHTDFLGDTVEEIAADKAQVAPEETPLVTAATGEARAAIAAEVGGEGEILVVGNEEDSGADVRVSYEGREGIEGRVSLAGEGWDIETPLGSLGAHQARNAGVAAALAREVGIELDVQVDEDTLARGLRRAHWPGRFEVMGRDPLVVFDGAHNPGACAALSETLAEFDYEDLYLVFGAMQDKDYREMSSTLPRPDRVLTARPATDRAEDSTVLATVFERAGVGRVESTESVAAALETALAESGPEDCVLVAGSLYTVAEARPRWTRRPTPKRVADRADAEDLLSRAGVAEVERERVAEDLPHHTVEIRADGREARALRETMDRLDGVCAIAAIDAADRERRDVVLAGTHDQFLGLLGAIESGTHPALGGDLARDLRAAIDGADAVSSGPIGSAVSDTEATANDHRGPTESGDGDSSSSPSAYPWSDRTAVMGILNTTPDSFHDGGRYEALEDAVARAETIVAAGADIVDVGGESTRPGADPVPVEEEIERVRPVIERVSELDALVSIDTRKAAVARAALDAGADVLNDVSGLEDPEMRFVAAEHEVPIILMHSIDAPVVSGKDVEYDDVVADAIAELGERVRLAEQAGVPREDIVVDPGIGFGKRSAESFELLGRIEEFHALGCPVLAGHSRKSMFDLVGRSGAGTADQGLAATVAGSAVAAERGADIVRVHDVAENVAAVRVAEAASDPERLVDRE
jgi:dihydropteroate synthase